MIIHRFSLSVIFLACTSCLRAGEAWGPPVGTARIDGGQLAILFRDNARSPRILSGIGSLVNVRHAPGFSAYTGHGGLNLEHIISGHRDPHNKFAPRRGRFTLHRLPDKRSVVLIRRPEDSPWRVADSLVYTVTPPYYVDFTFRCTPHDPSRFGTRHYAIFFFANYMNDVAEVPIHFLGVDQPGGKERWITADAAQPHPDWNQGGTYRSAKASELSYDEDQVFRLNSWSYDYPRFTRPFYFGRSKHGMVWICMFDRACTEVDQIRFSLFKFMAPDFPPAAPKHPAWDFQYVIRHVSARKEFGFMGRLVWKPFISREDCREEYARWIAGRKNQ